MKKTIKKILGFVIIAGLIVSCASQQSNQRQSSQRGGQRGQLPTFADLLSKMDTNNDGKLSEDEIKGPLKNDFSSVDTNNDGFISETEFNNAPKPERNQRSGEQGGNSGGPR